MTSWYASRSLFRTSSIMRNERSARFIASITWCTSVISPCARLFTMPSAVSWRRSVSVSVLSMSEENELFGPAVLPGAEDGTSGIESARAPSASILSMGRLPQVVDRLIHHPPEHPRRLEVRLVGARRGHEVDHLVDRVHVGERHHAVLV